MIQFKITNTDLEERVKDLLEGKFQSLEKYLGDETDLKCEVEFEKVTAQQNGNIHRVEANLYKGGKLYRAEATEDSFEKAIDEVRNELDKKMRRDNKRHNTLIKRGGQMLKGMMRRE